MDAFLLAPRLRYAESTNGFDNWEIIPLKIVHFCPRYRSNALKDEEQSSISYWRGRGADLLNKNKAITGGEVFEHTFLRVRAWVPFDWQNDWGVQPGHYNLGTAPVLSHLTR